MLIADELERLRSVQRECADAALAAQTEREREYCMLGVADNFIEEMIVLYWSDGIRKFRVASAAQGDGGY